MIPLFMHLQIVHKSTPYCTSQEHLNAPKDTMPKLLFLRQCQIHDGHIWDNEWKATKFEVIENGDVITESCQELDWQE